MAAAVLGAMSAVRQQQENQPGMIFAPYRICPLGAHVDHQGGVALGRTLRLGVKLEVQPLDGREIRLISRQFGETSFFIGTEIDKAHWARYAQAAARVLGDRLKRGMIAQIDGELAGSGLSSSTAVGLAYLKALAAVNESEISDEELIQLSYQLENEQLGLHNGLLDPFTIVYGQRNALLFMDMGRSSVEPIQDAPHHEAAWIIAYSGVSRELAKSGYNTRVEECRQAAGLLKSGAVKLSDVSLELFEEKKLSLPENLMRRAQHYFGEVERVQVGAVAWKTADYDRFGTLMNQSCQSSIQMYESGSPVLVELHEIVSSTQGIYGSRFSGGGYGGCVVALAKCEMAESAAAEIARQYSSRHPGLNPVVFVAEMGEGVKVLQ